MGNWWDRLVGQFFGRSSPIVLTCVEKLALQASPGLEVGEGGCGEWLLWTKSFLEVTPTLRP